MTNEEKFNKAKMKLLNDEVSVVKVDDGYVLGITKQMLLKVLAEIEENGKDRALIMVVSEEKVN